MLSKFFNWLVKKIKRISKRVYARYVIMGRRINDSKFKVTESQKYIMGIARMSINHPDSEFQFEPYSGKRYLKNSTLGVYIVFQKGKIEVTNHVYHYDVIVSDRNWNRIINMYNDVVEKNRLEYEFQIMSRVKHSLYLIHEKVLKSRNL